MRVVLDLQICHWRIYGFALQFVVFEFCSVLVLFFVFGGLERVFFWFAVCFWYTHMEDMVQILSLLLFFMATLQLAECGLVMQ